MADKLGISRVSYENKKKTGKFTALEAKKMCIIFKVKFDYLFETNESSEQGGGGRNESRSNNIYSYMDMCDCRDNHHASNSSRTENV